MKKVIEKKKCIICGQEIDDRKICPHCMYVNSTPNDVTGAISYVIRNAPSDIDNRLIQKIYDKTKELFINKLLIIIIVVSFGTCAAIATRNVIENNNIENKIKELMVTDINDETSDIFNYSLGVSPTNDDELPTIIEIPKYSIKDNIVIDLYTGYDINDFVETDEGVIIDSELNKDTSKLSIKLTKGDWSESVIKDVKIIDSNPYPIQYKIISEYGENPYTDKLSGWEDTVLIMDDKEHGKIEDYGGVDEFTLGEDNIYSGTYHANYRGYQAIFTVTFDNDLATVFVPQFIQNGADLIMKFKKVDK